MVCYVVWGGVEFQLQHLLEYRSQGYRNFKMKVGVDVHTDVDNVKHLANALLPEEVEGTVDNSIRL